MPSVTEWLTSLITLTCFVLAQSFEDLPESGMSRCLRPKEQLHTDTLFLEGLLEHYVDAL